MQVKKIHYVFTCEKCSHTWKHNKKECKKCPECGNKPKLTGFGGSIGPPPEEDIAYV